MPHSSDVHTSHSALVHPRQGAITFIKPEKKRQADGETKWWLGLQSWSWPDCFQVINGSNHQASDCLLSFLLIGQN